jgi:hypothetical protein
MRSFAAAWIAWAAIMPGQMYSMGLLSMATHTSRKNAKRVSKEEYIA